MSLEYHSLMMGKTNTFWAKDGERVDREREEITFSGATCDGVYVLCVSVCQSVH